jgi:hypothetical protein
MRKIDAFAHVLPAGYLRHLERHLASTMRPAELRYYRRVSFALTRSSATSTRAFE